MNIDQIFRFLDILSNKDQSGNTLTIAQKTQLAERAQIEFFNKEYKNWQETQEITDDLSPFFKSIPIMVNTTGQAEYPSDYVHVSSIRRYYVRPNQKSIEVPVNEINSSEIGDVLQSEIVAPTLRYPVVAFYDTYMQFYPRNIGTVIFDYLRQPVSPVWGFTVVNGRPVYDPNTSTQLEINNINDNELVYMMATYLGINLREPEVVQYAEMAKAQGN